MDKSLSLKQLLESAHQRIAELEANDILLQQTIQSYQHLFDYAGDSIFLIEPRSHEIVDVNSNVKRRFGYERAELISRPISDIQIVERNTNNNYLEWESTASGTQVYECHYLHKDGHRIPVEVSSRLVRVEGHDILQNLVRDITKRKEIENERERLITELDAFAHTVAHDLKNPLATVIGYANLLLDKTDPPNPDEAIQFTRKLLQTAKKMGNIVDELLILASVRKQESISLDYLDTPNIIQGALSRLAYMIEEKRAAIHMPTPKAWLPALGYAPWVEEVWTNYISNAIKYGGKPPIVELGSTHYENHLVRFWVRDNGDGIAAEMIPSLFTQFTRLDETRAQGHGLGLSIVHRIITRLGGQVAVESEVGKGSTFSFFLPSAQ